MEGDRAEHAGSPTTPAGPGGGVSPAVGAPAPPAAGCGKRRRAWVVMLGALALLGLALGYRQIASPDIGFHLATARWIVAHGWVPATDPLTWSMPERPDIDLQWLFQLLVYGAMRGGGPAAVVVLTTTLMLGITGLLLLRTWRQAGRLPWSIMLLAGLFFLGTPWEARPHLLSCLWGSLILWVLEEHARGARRGLAALPVLMMLWVNSHSLFILGVVIIGAYAGGSVGRCLLRRAQADWRLWGWSAAALLACLVNPYHIHGVLFPLVQFGDIQGGSAYKSVLTGIAEFRSPFSMDMYMVDNHPVLFEGVLFWQVFAVLAWVGWLGQWRKCRWEQWALLAGFSYIFCSANKNFIYFVMVAGPTAAEGLDHLGTRLRPRWLGRGNQSGAALGAGAFPVGTIVTVVLGGMLAVLVWSGRWYQMDWSENRRGSQFNEAYLPVAACAFMQRHHIQGRILDTWDDGGYIAWATGEPVFIYSHGEVVGQAFYRRYVEAKTPEGFAQALAQWQPTVALVRVRTAPFWVYYLHRDRVWRQVYADDGYALFLRGEVCPEIPALARAQPGVDYPAFDEAALREGVARATRVQRADWWQWLQGSRDYPRRELARSAQYYLTGQVNASIGVCLAGLQRTPYAASDLLLNLGHACNARGRYALADMCFDRFLQLDRDPQTAQEIRAVRQARSR